MQSGSFGWIRSAITPRRLLARLRNRSTRLPNRSKRHHLANHLMRSSGFPAKDFSSRESRNALRARLGSLVGRTATQMDIGNGGCTASVRTIQLVNNLAPEMRNVLILVMEPTSTLIDPKSTARSNWQGICTFGDGAAGVWISDEPGEGALALGKLSSWRGDATELIRWDWGTDYYRFGIAELEQFEVQVRSQVLQAMTELQVEKDPEAAWAIHPAGIMLLLSLAKKLGLARSALEPSINSFQNLLEHE